MKFLIDECVHLAVARALRAVSADVVLATDIMAGAEDIKLLAAAYAAGRVVVTDDLDYGDLVFRDLQPAAGVVLIRVAVSGLESARDVAHRIAGLQDGGVGAFTTLDAVGARVRALPTAG